MGHVHLGHDNFGARPVPVSSSTSLHMARSTSNLTLDTFSSNLASVYGARVSMPVRNRRCSVALREGRCNGLGLGDVYLPSGERLDTYLE